MLQRIAAVCLGVGFIASTSAAQTPAAKSTCRLVTPDEAAVILGSRPEMKEDSKQCNYVVAGQSLQLVVGFGDEMDLAMRRAIADQKKDSAIQDEPSLGPDVFSTRKPGSFDIWFGLNIDIGIRDAEGKTIPEEILDKLRAIAKKAMSRI